MSRFPRYLRTQLEAQDHANVDRAVRDSNGVDLTAPTRGTAPGDARKLRGIPAIGRSVRGAIPGTVPGEQLWR